MSGARAKGSRLAKSIWSRRTPIALAGNVTGGCDWSHCRDCSHGKQPDAECRHLGYAAYAPAGDRAGGGAWRSTGLCLDERLFFWLLRPLLHTAWPWRRGSAGAAYRPPGKTKVSSSTSSFLPKLVVVLGPTACGKSALGIALARRFNGEIVSADSRQVYRGLDIGTAKVTPVEQALVPHHLLDVADPREIYTVAQFQRDAIAALNALLARGHQPFLVGGSPHYIHATLPHPPTPPLSPHPQLHP